MGERVLQNNMQSDSATLPVCDVCPLKTVDLAGLPTELRQEFNAFIGGMVSVATEAWTSLDQPSFSEVYGIAIEENSESERALQCRHIGSSAISCARNKANEMCSMSKSTGRI